MLAASWGSDSASAPDAYLAREAARANAVPPRHRGWQGSRCAPDRSAIRQVAAREIGASMSVRQRYVSDSLMRSDACFRRRPISLRADLSLHGDWQFS